MTRHGSPTFYELLDEMAKLHDEKSHDYASNDNPSGNYHFAGELALLFKHSSKDAGFVGRIGEKLYRLANLESSGKTPKNETIEDTERDICVIICLWMADRRDRRKPMRLECETSNQTQEISQESKESLSENAFIQVIKVIEPILTLEHTRQLIEYLRQTVNKKK